MLFRSVARARDAAASNIYNLGTPYSHYGFVSIDTIVQWQTGNSNGLGSVFETALKDYYKYVQCTALPEGDPNSAVTFKEYNGYGDYLGQNTCGDNTICDTAYYSVREDKDILSNTNVCAPTQWKCMTPNYTTYVSGKNQYCDQNGKHCDYCHWQPCTQWTLTPDKNKLCTGEPVCKEEQGVVSCVKPGCKLCDGRKQEL